VASLSPKFGEMVGVSGGREAAEKILPARLSAEQNMGAAAKFFKKKKGPKWSVKGFWTSP